MKGMVYTTMVLLATVSGSAAAASAACEKAFKTVGDPRNGAMYMADITVPGLKVQSALDQLRQIGAEDEFEVGGQLVEGNTGNQYLIQTKGLRTPLVLIGTADHTGRVTLATKLARGQTIGQEEARQSMCAMLDKLKGAARAKRLPRRRARSSPCLRRKRWPRRTCPRRWARKCAARWRPTMPPAASRT